MSHSKFQKFIVVKHDYFTHLKSSSIDEAALTSDEIQMVNVLKDKKLN